MNLILRLIYGPSAAAGLCSTCVCGTVRKGFGAGEAETFCRLVGPNSRVPYAVRECTGYSDRRATPETAETRRIGFVTEIKLADENDIRSSSNSKPQETRISNPRLFEGRSGENSSLEKNC